MFFSQLKGPQSRHLKNLEAIYLENRFGHN